VILCDTGVLVAAALANDDYHQACLTLLPRLRRTRRWLLVPSTVVGETCYMLESRGGPRAEALFLESMAQGDFLTVGLTEADYTRMAHLIRQYASFPLGATDASIIAIAERLNVDTVATLDRRHFTAVRPNHVDALTLLPEVL